MQSYLAQSKYDKANSPKHGTFAGSILHDKASQYYWEGYAPLSIKTFSFGHALYSLGNGYYAVDDTSYLIVNHDQPYAITIEAETDVESFCLFFEPGFAEEIYCSLTTSTDHLLDEPVKSGALPLHFFERTYKHDDLLSPALFHLRARVRDKRYDDMWLHEQFHSVMHRLLQLHMNVYKEVEAVSAIRASTREELYRRLYRAKEYASAFFDTPVTLDEMAYVASLSPTHFLRTFKQLFQQTPYQYIISKRLECAQEQLRRTDRSVTDICLALGFESPGSFSRLFQQRFGCSPTTYRLQKR